MFQLLCRYLSLLPAIAGVLCFVPSGLSGAEPGSPTINLADPPSGLGTEPMPLKVVPAYPNLRVSRPIVLTGAGDGSGRLFIASQTGPIHWIDEGDSETDEANLFMDIESRVQYKDSENEEGLLGLAFHPKFSENGQFFIYYTTREAPHVSVISRFNVFPDDPTRGDPDSEEEILRIEQPFWNHNGGTLVFGPDGYLYVGLGDGGKANDPMENGQDLSTLLGAILRIDVDKRTGDRRYAIPADNPFVDQKGAAPEIFAYGIRNIWRMAFDAKTGDLWAADVGQDLWEEVNVIERGGNYGWNLREGGNPFAAGGKPSGPREDLIDPLVEYPHLDDWGKSVTGGAVYRGTRLPDLQGWYLYGDYVSGRLWAMNYDREAKKVIANRPIQWQQLPVFTFGETESGEVLMSTMSAGGRIYRFESIE